MNVLVVVACAVVAAAPDLIELRGIDSLPDRAAVKALSGRDLAALRAIAADEREAPLRRARALRLAASADEHRDPGAVDVVIARLLASTHPELRVQAAWAALARAALPGRNVLATARALLWHEDRGVREVALVGLWRDGRPGARALVAAHAAVEPDPVVRSIAERRLSRWRRP